MEKKELTDNEMFRMTILGVLSYINQLNTSGKLKIAAFFLPDECQVRIYLTDPATAEAFNLGMRNPQEGRFVSSTIVARSIVFAYSEFPPEGGESVKRACLNYLPFEVLQKAPGHIFNWLSDGVIPVADNVIGVIPGGFSRGKPTELGGELKKVLGPVAPGRILTDWGLSKMRLCVTRKPPVNTIHGNKERSNAQE